MGTHAALKARAYFHPSFAAILIHLCSSNQQYATTPFKGVERNGTFHNIMNLPVHFRENPKVSRQVFLFAAHPVPIRSRTFLLSLTTHTNFFSAGKDIIFRLLDKREATRLGSKSGASEVKQHKWFAKISWGLLRNTQPPVSVFLFYLFWLELLWSSFLDETSIAMFAIALRP